MLVNTRPLAVDDVHMQLISSPLVGLGEDETSGGKKKKRRERKKPLAELDNGQVLPQQSLQVSCNHTSLKMSHFRYEITLAGLELKIHSRL